MNPGKSLKARAVRRLGITLVFYVLIVLVPAGSLRFWQAWLFLAHGRLFHFLLRQSVET
jgi:hypothetical protein